MRRIAVIDGARVVAQSRRQWRSAMRWLAAVPAERIDDSQCRTRPIRFLDGVHTERGEVNIGQLCRQAYGSEVALIGFATHSGTVAAASEWDAPMEIKTVLLAQIAKSIPWSISDGRGDVWEIARDQGCCAVSALVGRHALFHPIAAIAESGRGGGAALLFRAVHLRRERMASTRRLGYFRRRLPVGCSAD